MKKNICILLALAISSTTAFAQTQKAGTATTTPVKNELLVNTSHSNIRNHGMTTANTTAAKPVKQETAIQTSRSNIKHQNAVKFAEKPVTAPVKK